MIRMASQITSLMIVYSTVYSGADQRKHQSSASLVFVWEIHRWPVNSPHKGPVTRKMFPFDDVIMSAIILAVPVRPSWNIMTRLYVFVVGGVLFFFFFFFWGGGGGGGGGLRLISEHLIRINFKNGECGFVTNNVQNDSSILSDILIFSLQNHYSVVIMSAMTY